MKDIALVTLALLCCALLCWRAVDAARARRRPLTPPAKRILFPFIGQALSQPVLDATLRLARAEDATLVPAYLARVPMHLPLGAPLPRQCVEAMPLLEAIEHRALHEGAAVDARIERGRTYRHALRELSRTSTRTASSSPPTRLAPTASTRPTSPGCSNMRPARSSCCVPRTTGSCAHRPRRMSERSPRRRWMPSVP